MRRAVRQIQTDDRPLNMVQDNITAVFGPLLQSALAQAKLLPQVALSTGDNLISHGFDRPYVTVFVAVPSASVTVYQKPSPDRRKYMLLNSSAPATADLLVL